MKPNISSSIYENLEKSLPKNNKGFTPSERPGLIRRFLFGGLTTSKKDSLTGFTLVEILVVTGIFAVLSVVMILNFRGASDNSMSRRQVAYRIIADIRKAQSKALSGAENSGTKVCGYGIHFEDDGYTYKMFFGKSTPSGCPSSTIKYDSGNVIEIRTLENSKLKMLSSKAWSKSNIYFEIPNPKTYVDEKTLGSNPFPTLTIQVIPANETECKSSKCTQIYIDAAGKIDITEKQ